MVNHLMLPFSKNSELFLENKLLGSVMYIFYLFKSIFLDLKESFNFKANKQKIARNWRFDLIK